LQKTSDLRIDAPQLDTKPEPHRRPLTADDERHAFRTGQPLWIRYEDKAGIVTERVIEIYRPGEDEVIYTWCRKKRAPRTFVRRNIRQWRLLPERFDFDPIVAKYWDEEGIRERLEKNPWRRWLLRQPKEIADRYT
jgi:predicted DNA-binding transcriptional regulator YafY